MCLCVLCVVANCRVMLRCVFDLGCKLWGACCSGVPDMCFALFVLRVRVCVDVCGLGNVCVGQIWCLCIMV